MNLNLAFVHPCVQCGACCAKFRVSFYWAENVPEEFTDKLNSHLSVMNGTNQRVPRCFALKGTLGSSVSCSIYELRPSPCRNFEASFESGIQNERCDQARAAIGLKALSPEDWDPNPREPSPPLTPAPLRRKKRVA